MSKVSFEDTPSSDGIAEVVLLDDIIKLEARVDQLESNINTFIRYVDSVRFTTAARDSAPWMRNWQPNLLSGYLTAPIPYESQPTLTRDIGSDLNEPVPLTASEVQAQDESEVAELQAGAADDSAVDAEVDVAAAVEAGELGVADGDAEEFVIVDAPEGAELAGVEVDAIVVDDLVDTGTGADLAVPADVADEDALADDAPPADDSETPVSTG